MPPKTDGFQRHLKKLYKENSEIAQIKADSSHLLCNATRAFITIVGKSIATEMKTNKKFHASDLKQLLLNDPKMQPLHTFVQEMNLPKVKRVVRKRSDPQTNDKRKRTKVDNAPILVPTPMVIEEDDNYDD